MVYDRNAIDSLKFLSYFFKRSLHHRLPLITHNHQLYHHNIMKLNVAILHATVAVGSSTWATGWSATGATGWSATGATGWSGTEATGWSATGATGWSGTDATGGFTTGATGGFTTAPPDELFATTGATGWSGTEATGGFTTGATGGFTTAPPDEVFATTGATVGSTTGATGGFTTTPPEDVFAETVAVADALAETVAMLGSLGSTTGDPALGGFCEPNGGACECGKDDNGVLITLNRFWGDSSDEQVMGCGGAFQFTGLDLSVEKNPSAGANFGQGETFYGWEGCCTVCGKNLQAAGKLSSGWYCEKDFFSTGIWLKGNPDAGVVLSSMLETNDSVINSIGWTPLGVISALTAIFVL